MTFQELSVLCFFCFLFLTFCKSKIITKYKVMKKKRKEKKKRLFSLPLVSGVIFTTKMLVWVSSLQIFLP